jgi:transcriptional regulator
MSSNTYALDTYVVKVFDWESGSAAFRGKGSGRKPPRNLFLLSNVIVLDKSTNTESPIRGNAMTRKKATLLQGTLDLLILKTLALEPMHGWGISKRIGELSDDVLEIGQGSLYPALYRLRDKGLVKSKWVVSDEDRRVKVYQLTRAGERALALEEADFRLFVSAVDQILDTV